MASATASLVGMAWQLLLGGWGNWVVKGKKIRNDSGIPKLNEEEVVPSVERLKSQ